MNRTRYRNTNSNWTVVVPGTGTFIYHLMFIRENDFSLGFSNLNIPEKAGLL